MVLSNALAAAVDPPFADPHLAREASYTAEGGAPFTGGVIMRRPDVVGDFGETRLWSETTRADVRVSDVAQPRAGDRFENDGEFRRPGRAGARS